MLTIPYGSKAAYVAAGWTEELFQGGIVEMPEPAGIRNVTAQKERDKWYDLEGRKVTATKKGRIYINNGRKVLVR